VTTTCRSRDFSFFLVGMHIDFGIDFDMNSQGVTNAFIRLTNSDLQVLKHAVVKARPALSKAHFSELFALATNAKRLAKRGFYEQALAEVELLITATESVNFDTTVGFNHEGNIFSRADHIRFTLVVKIIPFPN